MPLGDKLGADHNVSFTGSNRIKLKPQAFDAALHVGRKHNDPRIGKMRCHLFSNALHPWPAGNQMVKRTTRWAGIGLGFTMAAMVANDLTSKPVFNQPA